MRLAGLLVVVVGLALVFVGNYIQGRVERGQQQVDEGQEQINSSTQLFSLTPFTDWIGRGLSSRQQGEVNRGQEEVNHYAGVSYKFHKTGIIVSLVGVLVVGLSFIRFPERH